MGKVKRKVIFLLALVSCVLILKAKKVEAGVGESAVITLVFPPGARATGTAEAFTGVSDDFTATYYNPAGLGLSPLSNSWKVHLLDDKEKKVTSLASKKKSSFGERNYIWAGTGKGLIRYEGRLWEDFEIYLVSEGDNIEGIANKFVETEDKVLLKKVMNEICKANKLDTAKISKLRTILMSHREKDVSIKEDTITFLINKLIAIPSEQISGKEVKAILDTLKVVKIDESTISQIVELLKKEPSLEKITELKIPFSIAVSESVTALLMDKSDNLWVGTKNGLWRYSNKKWKLFTVGDGLPSNYITSIAAGPYSEIAVGTDKGVAFFKFGEWKVKADSSSNIPSFYITAIACARGEIIYAGTEKGLLRIEDSIITLIDTSKGLLNENITALFIDSKERLWIGSKEGVTIYDQVSWKRYRFPNSTINSIDEMDERNIWLATDKGVISYTAGKTVIDKDGNSIEMPPEWKAFHSKNALKGEIAFAVLVHDKDVWIATERAVNQYDNAEKQVGIAFELLLPQLKINDLWHLYGAFVWPTVEWGTIGFAINYINMGQNTIVDALGREERTVRSWEGVFGLSYGLTIREDFALGISAKYVVSALAPGLGENGEGVGQTFAIDAALLKRNFFLKNFDLGFMMQNMGPSIFYIDRSSRDPIPFTLRLGLAYNALKTPIHDLKFLLDMDKEIVKNNEREPDPFYKAIFTDLINDKEEDWKYELQEVNYHLGVEYWYANFVALRSGFLFDYIGERYEWTIGIGVRYSNINFDYSYIYAPEGFLAGILSKFEEGKNGATGVRDGQWRASFIFTF